MEDVKRGRGRPKDSGDDDSEALTMVARLVVDSPTLKPTTAMKRVRDAWQWRAASADALIRRWQVKWKASGAVYMQHVQAERAEAERQRQERAAEQRRHVSPGTARGLMANGSAARHASDWALAGGAIDRIIQNSAALDAMMRPSKDMLAVVSAMPRMGLSRADTVLAGVKLDDTMQRTLEITNVTGIGDAMRKFDTIGWAISAVHLPKLPKGF